MAIYLGFVNIVSPKTIVYVFLLQSSKTKKCREDFEIGEIQLRRCRIKR